MTIEEFVKIELGNDNTGHDFAHCIRVKKLARAISKEEGGNVKIIDAAALLHDCIDEKLFIDIQGQLSKIRKILIENNFSQIEIDEIVSIISSLSWHKHKELTTINGKIVQDADRLEAIGSIGIIRAIQYGTNKNRPFYNQENISKIDETNTINKLDETTISHFYEKLFHIKDTLNTKTAKKMAIKRDKMLHLFIDEFYDEI